MPPGALADRDQNPPAVFLERFFRCDAEKKGCKSNNVAKKYPIVAKCAVEQNPVNVAGAEN
jgi:hypothetical protein